MFRIPCPHCGLRNASEFRHVGERGGRPDPRSATPAQWRGYLYGQCNPAGWITETWYHGFGCRRFIGVERHTVTNQTRPAALGAAAGATGPGVDTGGPDAAGGTT